MILELLLILAAIALAVWLFVEVFVTLVNAILTVLRWVIVKPLFWLCATIWHKLTKGTVDRQREAREQEFMVENGIIGPTGTDPNSFMR